MPQAQGLRSGVVGVPGLGAYRGPQPVTFEPWERSMASSTPLLYLLLILLPGASPSSFFSSLFYILYFAFHLKLLAFEPANSFRSLRPHCPFFLLELQGFEDPLYEFQGMTFLNVFFPWLEQ